MPTDQPEPTIELEVKNLGPIAEAKIDLRPLTVFIGPNNTGKSYLATLIYALHQMFVQSAKDILTPDVRFESRFSATLEPLADNDSVRTITEWITAYLMGEASSVSAADEPMLVDAMTSALKAMLSGNDRTVALVRHDLARYLGTGDDLGSLVRHGSKHPLDIVVRGVRGSHRGGCGPFDYTLSIDRGYVAVACEFDHEFAYQPPPSPTFDEAPSGRFRRYAGESGPTLTVHTDAVVQRYAENALFLNVGVLARQAYYLPADRTGIMHAQPVMIGSMIDNASRPGSDGGRADAMLAGVLGDFLRQIVVGMSDDPSQASDMVEQIESKILHGKVHRTLSEAGYPRFAYAPEGWTSELSLMRVSSLVSELAPVVLYLKHLVEPGDTLIIDEPEAHLHPSAQVEFAIILARLVKSGVRVILTTHSEWMLDQFANLVRMSQLPEDERDDLTGSDAALTPDQFGAWLFETKKRPKGTVVREIDIDPDEGGLGRDYFDTAILTHNTWAEIGNRLTKLGLR